MFSRILVANRGEIAVRIIRACREMNISPAVVYSSADRGSLSVRLADSARFIGEAPAADSYLSIDRIVTAARAVEADAIHPGYGFLSENPLFVRACKEAGMTFIGPSAESMEMMGDKVQARRTAEDAGVPVVPGSDRSLDSLDEAVGAAGSLGYPVMLKARAGGGGKGLRLIRSEKELKQSFVLTRGEAEASFGDSRVFLEKVVPRPRHIEVQILGDQFGSLVHLGERESSIQRRHQKIVEECPSPRVGVAFREALGEAALSVARASGYFNAGTVEFLVDGRSAAEVPPFYFLEINARLQVEHPVTEMVYGVDLVKEQIRIAAGEPLKLQQERLAPRGAAVECRVYAEDPANDFFPSPGTVSTLLEPSGPGIRNDSGVFQGATIPVDYDPLISKLVAWGEDRAEALQRMRRALREYKVTGVATTIPFFRGLFRHPDFLKGDLTTEFLDEHALLDTLGRTANDEVDAAVIGAALDYYFKASQTSPSIVGRPSSPWRRDARQRGLRIGPWNFKK